MKKILLVSLLCVAIDGSGQTALTYTEVVKVDSASTKELYNRAKLWFGRLYNSSKDVLQVDNKEDGQIMGKASFEYKPTVFVSNQSIRGNIEYSIEIFLKDGRYKYSITNFMHRPTGLQYVSNFGLITTDNACPKGARSESEAKWNSKVWNDLKTQIESNTNLMILSLKQGMQSQTETKNEDW